MLVYLILLGVFLLFTVRMEVVLPGLLLLLRLVLHQRALVIKKGVIGTLTLHGVLPYMVPQKQ